MPEAMKQRLICYCRYEARNPQKGNNKIAFSVYALIEINSNVLMFALTLEKQQNLRYHFFKIIILVLTDVST